MIIGITGGMGSGKSAVSSYLKKQGFVIVDADKASRNVTKKGSPALENLIREFGPEILTKNGVLKRKKLGSIAFADKEKTKILKDITTKEILRICLDKIEKAKQKNPDKHIVFDVPLMFESGWNRYCDCVWTVSCPVDIRVRRVMERDRLPEEQIRNRISNQMSDEERESRADVVIVNDKSLDELYKAIDANLTNM